MNSSQRVRGQYVKPMRIDGRLAGWDRKCVFCGAEALGQWGAEPIAIAPLLGIMYTCGIHWDELDREARRATQGGIEGDAVAKRPLYLEGLRRIGKTDRRLEPATIRGASDIGH